MNPTIHHIGIRLFGQMLPDTYGRENSQYSNGFLGNMEMLLSRKGHNNAGRETFTPHISIILIMLHSPN